MKVTVLKSGSKGNSTLIETKTLNILIDAGITLKELQEYKNDIKIDIVFITHSHTDHTSGLKRLYKNFSPIIYTRNETVLNSTDFKSLYLEKEIFIDNLDIISFNLSHDSDCIGFLIKDLNDNNELVYITDTGYINKKILDIIKNKNTYIIESNHDVEMLRNGSYPFYLKQRILSDTGHLSNKDCCRYLKDLIGSNTKNIILAHLSENNNTKDKALEEINQMINENCIKDVNIFVAEQHKNLEKIEV